MTEHDSFTDRLSEFLDDEELGARERAEIAAHVERCAACSKTLAELRAVAARAASLTDAAPAGNLWPGIVRRIEQQAVLPFPATSPRRISFTIPQAVAAALALMVVSGGLAWVAMVGGSRTDIAPIAAVQPEITPANFADAHYEEAIADLEKALEAGRSRLDPQTVRVLEENLLAIDRAIEQSRRALRADPANTFLNTHLADARKRKLALLRSATALANKS